MRERGLTFLVPEETAPANDLGNLRRHHMVPAFVPAGDVFEHVPGRDRQIPPLASPGAKAGNIRGRFLKKSRGFDNFASLFP